MALEAYGSKQVTHSSPRCCQAPWSPTSAVFLQKYDARRPSWKLFKFQVQRINIINPLIIFCSQYKMNKSSSVTPYPASSAGIDSLHFLWLFWHFQFSSFAWLLAASVDASFVQQSWRPTVRYLPRRIRLSLPSPSALQRENKTTKTTKTTKAMKITWRNLWNWWTSMAFRNYLSTTCTLHLPFP